MMTFIILFIVVELLLIGLYAYMKPRGGIKALFVRRK